MQQSWFDLYLTRPCIQGDAAELLHLLPRATLDRSGVPHDLDELIGSFLEGDGDKIVHSIEEVDEVVEVPLELAEEVDSSEQNCRDLLPLSMHHRQSEAHTKRPAALNEVTYVLLLNVDARDLREDIAELPSDFHELVRCSLRALPARAQLRLRHGKTVLCVPGVQLGGAATRGVVRLGQERVRPDMRGAELQIGLGGEGDYFSSPGRDLGNEPLHVSLNTWGYDLLEPTRKLTAGTRQRPVCCVIRRLTWKPLRDKDRAVLVACRAYL